VFLRTVNKLAICLSLIAVTTGCSRTVPSLPLPTPEQTDTLLITPGPTQTVIATPTPEPVEPRLLSICIGNEPESLYFYGNHSGAEFNIFQAIYDGPIDLRGYAASPVILDELPTQANGGARIESTQVNPGELIVDAAGKWVNLEEGVQYFPGGCTSLDCAQTYSGKDPVTMDSLVLTFKLLPGILWSDGTSLTASDSVYSFELARSVYPAYYPEVVALTRQYQALDDLTIQWTGVPGAYGGPYEARFFSPLPRQAWSGLSTDDLPTAEISSRKPMGWGPYIIEQWTPGDHISLKKNENYFRAGEGLPYFDELVFRFVSTSSEALDALRAGECDLADETTGLTADLDQVLDLEASGDLKITPRNGTAWEQISFGISSIDPQKIPIFASREVRQAVSMCIDRQALAAQAFSGQAQVIDSYVLTEHPLYNS